LKGNPNFHADSVGRSNPPKGSTFPGSKSMIPLQKRDATSFYNETREKKKKKSNFENNLYYLDRGIPD